MNHGKFCKSLPKVLLSVCLGPSALFARAGCKAFHTQLLCLPCNLPAPAAQLDLYSGTVLKIAVPFPCCDPETTTEPEGGNTTPLQSLLKQHLFIFPFWCFVLGFFFSQISQQSSFCVFCRVTLLPTIPAPKNCFLRLECIAGKTINSSGKM